jgi:uncharacterized protein
LKSFRCSDYGASSVSVNSIPENPDTFIITGDIPAMWQRDSSAQVTPYLHLVGQDSRLQQLLRGLIFRQARNVLLDAYANAFLLNASGTSPWDSDHRSPPMKPGLWEGKYELDSLMSVVHLATKYFSHTKDGSICMSSTFMSAMSRIMDVVQYQQKSTTEMHPQDELFYSFGRMTTNSIDTLFGGTGQPSKPCGLSRSPFRPSDDSHVLPFLVPANGMAAAVLEKLSQMLQSAPCSEAPNAALMSSRAGSLAAAIRAAVLNDGIVNVPGYV